LVLLVNEIGCTCVILEANQRAGGRNLTLRPGDVLQEEGFAPQKCDFDREENQPYEPYLNAGPGRLAVELVSKGLRYPTQAFEKIGFSLARSLIWL